MLKKGSAKLCNEFSHSVNSRSSIIGTKVFESKEWGVSFLPCKRGAGEVSWYYFLILTVDTHIDVCYMVYSSFIQKALKVCMHAIVKVT
jgi:hypothetical protein